MAKNIRDKYFAGFSLFVGMAYYVSRVLHIAPNEILDEWSVTELIVAYGYYANIESDKAYQMWLSNKDIKGFKGEKPRQYAIKFLGVQEDG